MPQPLGDRIGGWAEGLKPWVWVSNYWAAALDRHNHIKDRTGEVIRYYVEEGQIGQAFLVSAVALTYTVFGDVVPVIDKTVDIAKILASAPVPVLEVTSDLLREAITGLMETGVPNEFAELVGTIVTEPVMQLLEKYSAEEDPDPKAFARAFHGIASGLPWAAGTIDSVLRAKWGPRAPQVGPSIMSLYWGLGMGFLGWQTLAPLLGAGLQPNLTRYYNRLYKHTRFTPAQASDLFALGEITGDELKEGLRDQGWREKDLGTWLKLSYRTLGQSVVWDLFHEGHIDKDECDRRLRALGFSPEDITLLYKVNEKPETKDVTRYLLSTAKSSFRDGLIDETEFRQILTAMKYKAREIDLQVELIQAEKVHEARKFSVSQIEDLYLNRVIGGDEAKHHLGVLDFSPESAGQLVEAWDVAATPRPARINRATILEGFTDGVLSHDETMELLQVESGFTADKADLLIRIEVAQAPRDVILGPQGAAPASVTMMSNWAAAGLIERSEMETRPELERFHEDDQVRIIDLMYLEPTPIVVELSPSLLAGAYIQGVITREIYGTRLMDLAIPEEDVELIIRTVELQNPQVFGEVEPEEVREPTLALLAEFARQAMITRAEMQERPEFNLFSAEDKDRIIELMYRDVAPPDVVLSASFLKQAFVWKVITEDQWRERLAVMGVKAADIDIIVEVTRQQYAEVAVDPPRVIIRQPTVGALQLALQRGMITEGGFRERLAFMGYSLDAAEIFLLNAQYQVPASPRDLSKGDVIRFYKEDVIYRAETYRRLQALRYTVKDAELLVRAEGKQIIDLNVAQWFLSGWIDQTGFMAIVTDEGFGTEEIDEFLETYKAGL